VIPRAQDLAVFLKLLARSATGQALSVYTSFLSGPRRAGEIDGPDEFYVVLLDNGRTKLLPSRAKRQSLYCIRCAACLNTCPVYRKIGGHSFPWVYSGPIGAIITPQFMGVSYEPGLRSRRASAAPAPRSAPSRSISRRCCSICGPTSKSRKRARRRTVSKSSRTHVRVDDDAPARLCLGRLDGAPRAGIKCWPVRAWNSQRDLPPIPRQSFRDIWSRR